MFVMATCAAYITKTLWFLIVLKLEIMLQVAPSIILGLLLKNLKWNSILYGMITGLIVTILFKFFIEVNLYFSGIHAGIFGLFANLIVVYILHMVSIRWKHSQKL